MQPNQVEIDEAFAASLLYDFSELTINDSVITRQIQQQEEEAFLIADERLAKELEDMEGYPQNSLSDDEQYAILLQEELNRSTTLHYEGESSSHHQSHVGSSLDPSSHSVQTTSPNVDIDPENMSYEELNELGESIGAVNKGLSKSRINQIPTHKFGVSSWFKKKVPSSEKSQCSICLAEFKQGDTVSTLPCAHIYHKECISHWLEQNKICCVCKAEVGP